MEDERGRGGGGLGGGGGGVKRLDGGDEWKRECVSRRKLAISNGVHLQVCACCHPSDMLVNK